MEKNSTFLYLYDNIECYEDLINADEIFEIEEDLEFLLDNLKLFEQTPDKEITDRIVEYSKSF